MVSSGTPGLWPSFQGTGVGHVLVLEGTGFSAGIHSDLGQAS